MDFYIFLGADINKTRDNKPVVMRAMFADHKYYHSSDWLIKRLIKYLVKNGAKIDARDGNGNTALMITAQKGMNSIVELLLEINADPNLRNNEGMTALMLVFDHPEDEYIGKKIENNCSMYKSYGMKYAHLYNNCIARIKEKRTFEFDNGQYAIRKDFIITELLIQNRVDLSAQDPAGRTALMWAISSTNTQAALYIAEHSDQLNQLDKKGDSALHYAIKNADIKIVKSLLAAGADTNIKKQGGLSGQELVEKRFPSDSLFYQLFDRIQRESWSKEHSMAYNDEVFSSDKKIDIHSKTRNAAALEPLDIALLAGSYKSYTSLIKLGSIKDKRRLYKSYFAFKRQLYNQLLQHHFTFLRNGIEPPPVLNVVERKQAIRALEQQLDSWSPLMKHLTAHIYSDAAHLITQKTAHQRSFFSRTPLMIAARSGNVPAIKQLLKFDAKINSKDIYGWTALMYAVVARQSEVVEILLKHGAKVHLRNKSCINVMGFLNSRVFSKMMIKSITNGYTGVRRSPKYAEVVNEDDIRPILEKAWKIQKPDEAQCTKQSRVKLDGLANELDTTNNIFVKYGL